MWTRSEIGSFPNPKLNLLMLNPTTLHPSNPPPPPPLPSLPPLLHGAPWRRDRTASSSQPITSSVDSSCSQHQQRLCRFTHRLYKLKAVSTLDDASAFCRYTLVEAFVFLQVNVLPMQWGFWPVEHFVCGSFPICETVLSCYPRFILLPRSDFLLFF